MQKDVEKFGISQKRGRTRTSDDPYLPEAGPKEPGFCPGCQALYQNKHWAFDAEALATARASGEIIEATCPACQKIAESYPEGVVTLSGGYLWAHEEEIRNLLANEEEKARGRNSLLRIMRITRTEESLTIETTEKKFAEHLGRAVHKAHQGELKVNRGNDQGASRVHWERLD
ncbi:MAG: BCAM0308 family protein [Trichloromonadaceae bacterium]